ncbi:flagellar filament capping protein FliD [Natranaerofaba carboxydovora]|uniref:flagellar filament capping protein FliD n=1 Tax=Natranaerofaba carboxydovora TaxID=2742683 RepID=UPI001F12E3BF|nr:flagellar filament capping protein FliD [Natranaerofaba carboxydovora]UMZ74981.1 Flagellar hook-associated protein 2 [Natranaerofaba carboxydovora]
MRIDGIVSGLDTREVVEQLMDIERRQPQRIEREIETVESQKDAWREVNSALLSFSNTLSSLGDKDTFVSKDASSSADNISVSASNNASEGSYNIGVEQVATAHRLSSGDEVEGEFGEEYGSGTGRLMIEIDGKKYVFLIEEESSLEDVMDMINSSDLLSEESDDDSVPVSARIIENRLVIEADKTGLKNQVTLSDDDTGVLDWLRLDEDTRFESEAEDARIYIEDIGQTITRSENIIDDLFDGVSIDISGVSLGEGESLSSRITVSQDTDRALEAVRGFVEGYNKAVDLLNKKGFVEAGSNGDVQSGTLQGESLLNSITRNIRTNVTNPVSLGDNNNLSIGNIGIQVDRHGEMSLDEDKFLEALNDNEKQVKELLSEDKGISGRVKNYLDNVTFSDNEIRHRSTFLDNSFIGNRIINLRGSIDRKNDQIERLETRIDRREENLLRQFQRMEEAFQRVQSESQWLWMSFNDF